MSDAAALRPLGLGDILDESIRLYKDNLWLLLKITLIALAPGLLIQLSNQALQADLIDSDAAIALLIVVILGGIASFVLGILSHAALIHALAALRMGERPTVGSSYDAARRRFWKVLTSSLAIALAAGAMSITLIGIPFAIYFLVAWAFTTQAIVVEGTGARQGMSRSRELVRGQWWRTVGVALVFLLLYAVVASILAVPIGLVAGAVGLALGGDGVWLVLFQAFAAVWSLVANALVGPLSYCAWVIYYFDLRVRREGLDLQRRVHDLASNPAT